MCSIPSHVIWHTWNFIHLELHFELHTLGIAFGMAQTWNCIWNCAHLALHFRNLSHQIREIMKEKYNQYQEWNKLNPALGFKCCSILYSLSRISKHSYEHMLRYLTIIMLWWRVLGTVEQKITTIVSAKIFDGHVKKTRAFICMLQNVCLQIYAVNQCASPAIYKFMTGIWSIVLLVPQLRWH